VVCIKSQSQVAKFRLANTIKKSARTINIKMKHVCLTYFDWSVVRLNFRIIDELNDNDLYPPPFLARHRSFCWIFYRFIVGIVICQVRKKRSLSLSIIIPSFSWFFTVHSFLGERSRAIREVNLRAKQLSEPAVMYFHICETKALNRWKLVSYYKKGRESGRGERKRREEKGEMRNKRGRITERKRKNGARK